MEKITGKTLFDLGYKQGPWFSDAIKVASALQVDNASDFQIKEAIKLLYQKRESLDSIALQASNSIPIHYNIDVETDFEKRNFESVKRHIDELAKIPTIKAISVMPDACPSGQALGTIPVGGIAVAENAIHPGLHSNDICCSVAVSYFDADIDPILILDAGMKLSHFGQGSRYTDNPDINVPYSILQQFETNPFLTTREKFVEKYFGMQGDGNHFFYVGRLVSDGKIALVTHHGSRKPGALLYKAGMIEADKYTSKVCREVGKHNGWIPYNTKAGQDYWSALQIVRQWTKASHFAIHNSVAKNLNIDIRDQTWNEHNFVFKRTINGKEYFYHAKGATPNYKGFAEDSLGTTLIPLNMASPILVNKVHHDSSFGTDFEKDKTLGFCPHGAGRNFSRTEFVKRLAESGVTPKQLIEQTLANFDIRAYSGKQDISEFPLAYKSPEQIIRSIEKYKLTTITDKIEPIGCIMAGHNGINYKEIKRKKRERLETEQSLSSTN